MGKLNRKQQQQTESLRVHLSAKREREKKVAVRQSEKQVPKKS